MERSIVNDPPPELVTAPAFHTPLVIVPTEVNVPFIQLVPLYFNTWPFDGVSNTTSLRSSMLCTSLIIVTPDPALSPSRLPPSTIVPSTTAMPMAQASVVKL